MLTIRMSLILFKAIRGSPAAVIVQLLNEIGIIQELRSRSDANLVSPSSIQNP